MQPSTPPCSVMIHEEVTCVVVISSFICIAIFTAFGSSLVDVIPKIFDIGKYIFGKLYIFITIIRFFRAIIIYIKLTYKGLVITQVINQYLIIVFLYNQVTLTTFCTCGTIVIGLAKTSKSLRNPRQIVLIDTSSLRRGLVFITFPCWHFPAFVS